MGTCLAKKICKNAGAQSQHTSKVAAVPDQLCTAAFGNSTMHVLPVVRRALKIGTLVVTFLDCGQLIIPQGWPTKRRIVGARRV
jgi:hypothetical protein